MSEKSITIDNKKLTFRFAKFAPQANAAVLAQMGETIVLATVVSSRPHEDIDWFPLFVEYKEKLYAGGKIKGSRWVKREGRPSDEAILTARLVDRSIRPLFPKDYKNEVQIIITVLSVDGENEPDLLAIWAVSAALAISDIPWNGPVGAVRMGPPAFPDLDLVISGTNKEIVMIEAGANQVAEEKLSQALKKGMTTIKKLAEFISGLQKTHGQKKQSFKAKKIKPELVTQVQKKVKQPIADLLKEKPKDKERLAVLGELKEALAEEMPEESAKDIGFLIDDYFKAQVRAQILSKKTRFDGRKPDEIRPLSIETGVLPRTHGSAVFQRGLTQALTITTLASPSLEQLIENMEGEETKRYIHHYYMPPFSVGEVGRVGWPSRREVGHGALAERALEPLIPSEEQFPYTIRVVSEIMSSNGSTSMASVCGSSLSLMDAGVPLKKPVAGIAMGLVKKEKAGDYVILTDISGLEDHIGDMDFKMAGTAEGITAMQMDVKTLGITPKILIEGIAQAKKARLHILQAMKKVLGTPKAQVSKYAPRIAQIRVPVDKIGEVIGPGGRTIREIIKQTEVDMDVNDEGVVTIAGMDNDKVKQAIEWVEGLTREVEAGEIFEKGEVTRIEPFGAFVEILPGKKGLVHISEMSTGYVAHPSDVVKMGDKVKVRVKETDAMGRINLSMLFGEDAKKAQARPDRGQRRPGPRDSRPRSFQRRPRQGQRQFRSSGGQRQGQKQGQRQDQRRGQQRGQKKEKFTSYYFKKDY